MLQLKGILEKKPSLISTIMKHLEDIGETGEGATDDADAGTPKKFGVVDGASASAEKEVPDSTGGTGEGSTLKVPASYTTLGATPGHPFLEAIVHSLEPVALGPFALKALLEGRAKHVKKPSCSNSSSS